MYQFGARGQQIDEQGHRIDAQGRQIDHLKSVLARYQEQYGPLDKSLDYPDLRARADAISGTGQLRQCCDLNSARSSRFQVRKT